MENLRDCSQSKAPEPDGFSFLFYVKSWEVVGEEILALVREFHSKEKMPKGIINNSFITLVSKIKGAEKLIDFLLISLINGIYKVIANILFDRLGREIGFVISDCPYVFLENRNITDSALAAAKVVHWLKCTKRKTFLFEIDFKKAYYDHFRWDFLMIARR